MAVLRGQVVLEFLSFRDALAELYNIINTFTAGDVTVERYTEVKQEFENYVLKYNKLREEFMNGLNLKAEYQNINNFLEYYYRLYSELLIQERSNYAIDNTYFNLTNLAQISNYQNDIDRIIDYIDRPLLNNSDKDLP